MHFPWLLLLFLGLSADPYAPSTSKPLVADAPLAWAFTGNDPKMAPGPLGPFVACLVGRSRQPSPDLFMWNWDAENHLRMQSLGGADSARRLATLNAAAAPEAAMRAFVDVKRIFAALLRLPFAGVYEQVIRRLGGAALQDVTATVVSSQPQAAKGTAVLRMAGPPTGVFAAFAEPVPQIWPTALPHATKNRVVLSVSPQKMWQVLESVLGGLWPIQYSLARVQFDAFEAQHGKRWVEDIMGPTPQLWSLYHIATSSQRSDVVVMLGVADAAAARLYLHAASVLGRDLAGLRLTAGSVRQVETLTVSATALGKLSLYLAFPPGALLISTSPAVLSAQIANLQAPALPKVVAPSAVLYGVSDMAYVLQELACRTPRGPKAAGEVAWALNRKGDDWQVDGEVKARPAAIDASH